MVGRDLAFLEDLGRRLHTTDIETWVPEPVAREWAQHLADDWEKIQTATAEERVGQAYGTRCPYFRRRHSAISRPGSILPDPVGSSSAESAVSRWRAWYERSTSA